MAIDVRTSEYQDAIRLEVIGEVDGSTAPVMQERVLAAAGPDCRLLLDMSSVEYMSSAGLRVMLLLFRQISSNSGKVVLVGLSEDNKDNMTATGFLKYFSTAETLDDGITVLNNWQKGEE